LARTFGHSSAGASTIKGHPVLASAAQFVLQREAELWPQIVRGVVATALETDASQLLRQVDQVPYQARRDAALALGGINTKVNYRCLLSGDAIEHVSETATSVVQRDEDCARRRVVVKRTIREKSQRFRVLAPQPLYGLKLVDAVLYSLDPEIGRRHVNSRL
jgi:hypothetical protein